MQEENTQKSGAVSDAESAYESNSIFWVEVEKIVPNPYQPRKDFDEMKLRELADSIRMYGVLQPLVVVRKEVNLDNGAFRTEYELIAGERRLRASKLAGIAQVPVIIRSSKESELMKLELAIIENLQREDLNPVDRALAFNQLASQFKLTHKDIGRRMGRSRVYVANSIRLLGLPENILDALRNGELSDGHARALLMLKDRPEEQQVLFKETILKKLSVRDVEHLCRQVATDKVRKKSWRDLEPELKEMERSMSDTLGTKVQIAKTDYGGRVMIDYFSGQDLDQLMRVLRGESTWEGERTKEAEDAKAVLHAVEAATGLESTQEKTSVGASEISSSTPISQEEENTSAVVMEETTDDVRLAHETRGDSVILDEAVRSMETEEDISMLEDTDSMIGVTEDTDTGHISPTTHAIELDDPNDHTLEEIDPDADALSTESAPQEIIIQPDPDVSALSTAVPDVALSSVTPSAPTIETQTTDTPTSPQDSTPTTESKEEEKKDDGDDLYSLSNFSL